MAIGSFLVVSSTLVLVSAFTGTCPDNITQCITESTCCELISGQFGCCPIPNAVCCSDRQHCCPEGFHCIHDVCTRGQETNMNDVSCPDGQHRCPDQMTCCKSTSSNSNYACCPLPDAVCCSDGEHCCPEGTTCDLLQGRCLPARTDASTLTNARAAREEVKTIRSNDVNCSSAFSCPDRDTCCHVPNGSWGCCPLSDAVCCDDHVHCCPQGTRCGPTGCQGVNELQVSFYLQKSAANIKSVVCPGGQYECPDQTTCCQLSSGAWGCCPLPDAVCCDDLIHCCPQGTTCGPAGCLQEAKGHQVLHPFYLHGSAKAILKAVVCPGGEYECPDQTTCCQLSSGAWGCCPLPDAVCCDDRIHCCPNGYTCSSAGTCSRANGSSDLPWVRKQKAKPVDQSLS